MQQFFYKISKQIKRLIENVKRGSFVDIAILAACAVFAMSVVILLVSTIISNISKENDNTQSITQPISSEIQQDTSSQTTQSPSAIIPFPSQSQASSNTANQNIPNNSQSVTASAIPPVVSQSSSASQSSSQPVSSSSSSSQSQSDSTNVSGSVSEHVHTYGEPVWYGPCDNPYYLYTCTTCEPDTQGHEKIELLSAQDHNFIPNIEPHIGENGQVFIRSTCTICGAFWDVEQTSDENTGN